MYKLLLISKYLRKRRIAWVSLLAVCLCTAMVLVVLSVMGGWLRMFRENFQGLSGAVLVQAQTLQGFPHYEEMIDRIEKLPDVDAAAPVIQSFGLINIVGKKSDGVQVVGYPLDKIARINRFPLSLYRQYVEPLEASEDSQFSRAERDAFRAQAQQAATRPSFDKPFPPETYRAILNRARLQDPATYPGLIAGSGVLNIRKDENGKWLNRGSGNYMLWARLTVLGVNDRGDLDVSNKAERLFWVVDSSHTKVWQMDQNTVYVPFELLQRDLGMAPSQDADGKVTSFGRTSAIHIALRPSASTREAMLRVRGEVDRIVSDVLADHGTVPEYPPLTQTWEESQARYLAAIEKEVALVTTLFSFISVVAVFLIFCIFYMIVAEKTRDIGIIKSVGASSPGVAVIFIGYGLAIGIVGGLAGLGIGTLIVKNINYLHEQMGRLMGIQIWNPEVYAFDTIPNTVDPTAATIILAVAIISSVLGAVWPAMKAAMMNPVEAVRFE